MKMAICTVIVTGMRTSHAELAVLFRMKGHFQKHDVLQMINQERKFTIILIQETPSRLP